MVELLQFSIHGGLSLKTNAGTIIKLSSAYFVVKITGNNFIKTYVKIMYNITIISLVFYSLSIIPPVGNYFLNEVAPLFELPFKNASTFYKVPPNIIVFTFERSLFTDFRNSGPFWEPGGFASYLVIAILLNTIRSNRINQKINYILVIGVLTTFSTAGYIALFILFSGYYLIMNRLSNKILLFILIFFSISLYNELSFLKVKINNNITIAESSTSSRFGSALADYNLFIESPIVGWGRGPNRFGVNNSSYFSQAEHRNNGVFVLLATYGIIGLSLFYILYFKSYQAICMYYRVNKGFMLIAILTIFVIGFSQVLFSQLFFFNFLFLFLTYDSKKLQTYKS
jgi:hypothetical protein